jgi:hypothetical protein
MKGSSDPISSETFVLVMLPNTEEEVWLLASCSLASPMIGPFPVERMFTMGNKDGTSLEADKL